MGKRGVVVIGITILLLITAWWVGNKKQYTIVFYDWEKETFVSANHSSNEQGGDDFSQLLQQYNYMLTQSVIYPSDSTPITKLAVNTVSEQEDCLYIDFSDSVYRNKFGGSAEKYLLDGLMYTIFTNNPHINNIYISVNEQDYETGHYLFPRNGIYMDRETYQLYPLKE